LLDGAPAELAARTAVLAAGFVGKLHRADAPSSPTSENATLETAGRRESDATVVDAARARDVGAARAAAERLTREERLAAFPSLAPFLAFDAAVLPIFTAHMVKVAEACFRLTRADANDDEIYLDALLAFAVPRRRERRFARVARVASKFLADGKPPESLD
jgi:hypothetical protein